MIFEFDRWQEGRPYPNLARWEARPYTPEWRQFSHHWPFSEPAMLVDYLSHEGITANQGRPTYIISISFFDFSIDWPALLPANRLEQLQQGEIDILFYYSEGDNPVRMRNHLLAQFAQAKVAIDRVRMISANSAADALPGSAWFADDELLFRHRNRQHAALAWHDRPRSRLFTALVRTHKWWRATVMADFWRRGWHNLGYFAYNPNITVGDTESDNPIEVDRWPELRSNTHRFLQHQFQADSLTGDQHNDHHLIVQEHFADAYVNIVLETHMDADQSGGVFLTEKTFKPIKHAQPFLIFGCAHSLSCLRNLGYRTFDHVIDTSYDSIEDTTARYTRLMDICQHLFTQGKDHLHEMLLACRDDLLHNQRHFAASKQYRLNNLLEKLK